MVKSAPPVYLFIGEDSFSKDAKLQSIKSEFLASGITDFNLDILYARELTLKCLQERLLSLPLKGPKRIVVIKEAGHLREEAKKFLAEYVKKPYPAIILILDTENYNSKDDLLVQIARYAQILRFKETLRLDTFALSRQISQKKMDYALKILHQLLQNGEKPERILGGLRYALENTSINPLEARRKFKTLLNCDIDIKTGRLKPNFALERLVVSLCVK